MYTKKEIKHNHLLEQSAQEKYEEMKRNALNLNCAELNDLPPLECITCQKIRSFGGRQTFETNIFTIVDICKC